MSGATIQDDLVRGIIAEAKMLTVDRLKRALRTEGLQVSGIKSELQLRLLQHINDIVYQQDQIRLGKIRDAIRGHSSGSGFSNQSNPYPSPYSNTSSSASPQYYNSPTPRFPQPVGMPPTISGYSQSRATFKNSPFYTIQKQLCNTVELRAREQTRDTVRLTITLDEETALRMTNNPNIRAMVFCAAESFDSAWKPVDIAFPHHAELKCNAEDVKSNLKGLKNKPGSTRPVDITSFLRKKSAFPNTLELVYALTNKKYFLLVNLVQTRPIDALVKELKTGKYLSRERIIAEMQNRAKDDDIVATSSNMSLKDPVQMTRIETPCRSMSCKHNECFDAAVYLALQEQAPTWTCPLCNKPATWESLVFDQYVQSILQSTPSSAEQVTVEPDARWRLVKSEDDNDEPKKSNSNSNPSTKSSYDSDGDDLIEITDLEVPQPVPSIRTHSMTPTATFLIRTPPLNGTIPGNSPFTQPGQLPPPPASAASVAQSTNHPPASASRKRPREDVIDLTLDSDDDDDDQPPVSRIKRPSLASSNSDVNNRLLAGGGGPAPTAGRGGVGGGPFRFALPPPTPSMGAAVARGSPGLYYDRFNTRL